MRSFEARFFPRCNCPMEKGKHKRYCNPGSNHDGEKAVTVSEGKWRLNLESKSVKQCTGSHPGDRIREPLWPSYCGHLRKSYCAVTRFSQMLGQRFNNSATFWAVRSSRKRAGQCQTAKLIETFFKLTLIVCRFKAVTSFRFF